MRSENGLAKPKLGTRGVSRPYGLEFVEVGDIKTSAFCSINRCGTVRETLAFLKCQSVGGTVLAVTIGGWHRLNEHLLFLKRVCRKMWVEKFKRCVNRWLAPFGRRYRSADQ
jgi:hypothetical protein